MTEEIADFKGQHAPGSSTGGSEFTLCGMAYDAFETGDADEPIRFAAPEGRVTCPSCKTIMTHVRLNFVGTVYRPRRS